MSGEAAFWHWLRARLEAIPAPYCHHQRLEDMITPGVPDLNLCVQGRDFWLELKSLSRWPVRPATPVRYERYTTEQRDWLRDRWRAGGRAFLVLRVATPGMVLAWTGERAHSGADNLPRASLEASACGIWDCRTFRTQTFLRDLEGARTLG